MDSINNIGTIFGNSQYITDFFTTYASYLVGAALVFSLLNCFFGYALRKLWSCIFGLLLGLGAGISLGLYFNLSPVASLGSALAGGLIFTVLSFLLYRIGIFFLCIGVVIFTLFQLFPTPTFSTICGFVVFGIAVGFLAIVKEQIIVSIITALYGAVGSAKSILDLAGHKSLLFTVLLAIILAALGVSFQLKLWKKKKKHGGKIRKKNMKKRSRKKIQHQYRPKPTSQTEIKPQPSRPDDTISDKTRIVDKPSRPDDSNYTVDLSDIRSEISREIQDIYNEESKDQGNPK